MTILLRRVAALSLLFLPSCTAQVIDGSTSSPPGATPGEPGGPPANEPACPDGQHACDDGVCTTALCTSRVELRSVVGEPGLGCINDFEVVGTSLYARGSQGGVPRLPFARVVNGAPTKAPASDVMESGWMGDMSTDGKELFVVAKKAGTFDWNLWRYGADGTELGKLALDDEPPATRSATTNGKEVGILSVDGSARLIDAKTGAARVIAVEQAQTGSVVSSTTEHTFIARVNTVERCTSHGQCSVVASDIASALSTFTIAGGDLFVLDLRGADLLPTIVRYSVLGGVAGVPVLTIDRAKVEALVPSGYALQPSGYAAIRSSIHYDGKGLLVALLVQGLAKAGSRPDETTVLFVRIPTAGGAPQLVGVTEGFDPSAPPGVKIRNGRVYWRQNQCSRAANGLVTTVSSLPL